MGEGSFKAPKGLIRVKLDLESSQIEQIVISGDFFMYPEERLWELEKSLRGTSTNRPDVLNKIREFYQISNVLSPGISPEDFTEAIFRAIQSSK